MRKKKGRPVAVLPLLLLLAVTLWFFASIRNLDTAQEAQGCRQLEEALRRAAVACYAAEGRYPSHAEYLAEHYGVQIDDSRYTVFYEIFAENLMPDITVVEKGK